MKRGVRVALVAWLVLLAASHLVRWQRTAAVPRVAAPDHAIELASARVVYRDEGPRDAPVVLLLHGSPGSRHDFRSVTPVLAERFRVIAPDLPGFGASTRWVPDYSIRSHAAYGVELIERLGIERVHVVGYSMGGGVGIELYGLAPERIASLTLLSSIGVQELELFGAYRMNHLVHGVQLAAVRFVEEGLPHFGLLDGVLIGRPYARNFYDTDQRPLRGILEGFDPPMLILHGSRDPLVSAAAATEHERLVPQSELQMLPGSHFMVFTDGDAIGRRMLEFIEKVESGAAPTRADASPERVRLAGLPFDPAGVPPLHGIALVLLLTCIGLATLVSEDLTCIVVGLMAAQGRVPFVAGTLACCAGIFIGDMLLFAAGRWLGRAAIERAPLKWLIRPDQIDLSSRWFNRRGPIVIGISRFVPGMRLPTYFAAGLLRTSALRFAVYFGLAVAVWTPLLVGASAWIGESVFGYFDFLERRLAAALLVLGLWILIVVKLLVPLFTWRGRRRLIGAWRRWTRWEFWPPWLFYPPVALYVLWLGLRFRAPLLFTAANPAIEASGFIAESKHSILQGLNGSSEWVARHAFLSRAESVEDRLEAVTRFLRRNGLDYPVVLKPDAGQRGSGVAIVRSREQARTYFEVLTVDALVQEYVPGYEFGVFYARRPGDERGRVFSITEKTIPFVRGDGASTLERLILEDPRAVAIADKYLARLDGRSDEIPPAGARVDLAELGTHCRGAIFLDGARFGSAALERRIDAISRGYDGFFFGRYDVRARDPEELAAGAGFKIIELNGVTSEATHIYDPAHSLTYAYKTLFRQWREAFEIGRRNRRAGHQPADWSDLVRLLRAYHASSRAHPE